MYVSNVQTMFQGSHSLMTTLSICELKKARSSRNGFNEEGTRTRGWSLYDEISFSIPHVDDSLTSLEKNQCCQTLLDFRGTEILIEQIWQSQQNTTYRPFRVV